MCAGRQTAQEGMQAIPQRVNLNNGLGPCQVATRVLGRARRRRRAVGGVEQERDRDIDLVPLVRACAYMPSVIWRASSARLPSLAGYLAGNRARASRSMNSVSNVSGRSLPCSSRASASLTYAVPGFSKHGWMLRKVAAVRAVSRRHHVSTGMDRALGLA